MLQINQRKRNFRLKRCGTILMIVMFTLLALQKISLAENVNQLAFASPEEAVTAMNNALSSNDLKALEAIFGPDSKDLITSGDPVADQSTRDQFLKLYVEKNRLEQTNDTVILYVGNEDWPFPIPIVKQDDLWQFNTRKGLDELLARRIGRNELNVIQVCLSYVDAQHEYARKDRNTDGLLQYARKFKSDRGKKNGLYWETKAGEEQSPLGPLIAEAREYGYGGTSTDENPSPYYGYYYRILTAQGKDAPGGAYDYLVKGQMIGGFALVAFPARYESSGIMTFIVNHRGAVYQKDLGLDTEKEAQSIKLFNPDKTWKKVDKKDTRIND